jgi:hypothetical protein
VDPNALPGVVYNVIDEAYRAACYPCNWRSPATADRAVAEAAMAGHLRTRHRVRYTPGVPRWFVRLHHRWAVRRCRKRGHVGTPVPGGCCVHCGHVWGCQ